MGIWELICSTTEAVKRNAPDATPIKKACETSYGYCSAAGGKIGNAVSVNSQKVKDYMQDGETRSQIGLFASMFALNAARRALWEGYKLVPGGKMVAEIFSDTLRDVESEKQRKQEMEAKKANESPEDVLRIFMMKGFTGNPFADELLLPQIKYMKKSK